MIDYEQHEKLKQLSLSAYRGKKNNTDYEEINTVTNYLTGFRAKIYKNGSNVVIAYCGSDSLLDWTISDAEMLKKYIPVQTENARRVYREICMAYPNSNIYLTGHSLGGSLAQIIGSETGAETVTFSAYGTANLYGINNKYNKNITNYGNAQDAVFVANIDNQIGKTMILDSKIDSNALVKSEEQMNKISLSPHRLENYGDLSKGIEYKKEIFEDEKAPLFKMGIEYNDYNPDEVFDTKNRVLYRGEINPDDLEEGTHLYDLYIDKITDWKPFPSKKELNKRVRIGELIYVEEYTRSDGTKVSGYYRAYPRK